MRFPDANLAEHDLLNRQYPVGCVYSSVDPTNPAILFGFGTWVAFGAGRVLVGVDPGDPDWDAAEKTSGAKTVTLTEAQIPPHTHVQDAHGHGVTDPGHTHVQGVNSTATGGLVGATPDTSTNTRVNSGYSTSSATTGVTVNDATAVNQNAGGGQPHSNVQPSLAVFRWKRTA
jgi:microcystin-dependent protein